MNVRITLVNKLIRGGVQGGIDVRNYSLLHKTRLASVCLQSHYEVKQS